MKFKNEFSTHEAAGFLGLERQTLANWRYEGKGPRYYKKGKNKNAQVIYKRSDLLKFKKSYLDVEIPVDTRIT